MAKTETALKNELRENYLEDVKEKLENDGSEVLRVSSTELAIADFDIENNERWVLIKFSIPKGEKIDGGFAGYDGNEARKEYLLKLEKAAKDADEKAAKKAKDIANKKAKKEKAAKEKAEKEEESVKE